MLNKPRIVVVGSSQRAGVSGLTTALELAKTGRYDVTVIAKHMPGDYDIEYASPWAGANYEPVAVKGTPEEQYERDSWLPLAKLAREAPEAGVHFQDHVCYTRKAHANTPIGSWKAEVLSDEGPWWKDLMPNYRKLSPSEAPKPFDSGLAFTSMVINISIYLPWLASQCLAHGVKLRRGIFAHIVEAKQAHASGQPADLIVNATGLASAKLPGVRDPKLFPARGQVVLIRNEPQLAVSTSGIDGDDGGDTNGELCYIMQRAVGGGTILGGCYQKNDWNKEVDMDLARRIMERTVKICPSLTDEKSMPAGREFKANRGIESLSIVRHTVGLRPCREGGIRVEIEKLSGDEIGQQGETFVVHNYGHGGTGYQSSYGCAFKVVRLVDDALGA